jgi:type IV secretory pathway component VirB8
MSKDKENQIKIHNWYSDRYMISLLQRNFLFLFAIFASLSTLVSLVTMKKIYESKSIIPYLIEFDKNTGMIVKIESSNIDNFVSQDIIKESMLDKYIKAINDFVGQDKDSDNIVRIFSSKSVYQAYKTRFDKEKYSISSIGYNPKIEIKISSITQLTNTRSEVKYSLTIKTDNKDDVVKYKIDLIDFSFASLKLTKEDAYKNPLGFQVTNYSSNEEKKIDE